jgi:hypothetical protein
MEAINLIHRYDKGEIDNCQTGIFSCIDRDDIENPEQFIQWMFGGGHWISGRLEIGKTYIYAYSEDEGIPEGFTELDEPAMVLRMFDGDLVFIYEIEGV